MPEAILSFAEAYPLSHSHVARALTSLTIVADAGQFDCYRTPN